MSKIIILLCAVVYFTDAYSSEIQLDNRRITTATGKSKSFYLEVDTEVVKKTPRFNPEYDDLPISVKEAINLATSAYKEKYGEEPNNIGSVKLARITCCGTDYWYYKVELQTNFNRILWAGFVAVLFDGTVIFHREE